MLLTQMNPGLPSALHFGHVHTPAVLPLQTGAFPPSPLHMPPSKRPKLSLQTSQISTTYGSSASATGKRADDMSAATPTTANTFDLSIRPSPSSATASPATYFPRVKATASPLRRSQPYSLNLPLGVKSILKNSRLASDYRRGSLTASASPRTGRRVFFPPAKKVSFHAVDEEIITHTYTARHIDSSSSENEEGSSGSELDELPEQDVAVPSTGLAAAESPAADLSRSPDRESRGRRRRQRSTSSVRTNKKRRRWEWTLENPEEGDIAEEGGQEQTAISRVIQQPSQNSAVDKLAQETLAPVMDDRDEDTAITNPLLGIERPVEER